MKFRSSTFDGISKGAVAAASLAVVLAATGAQAKPLTLNFDNGNGVNPTCTGSNTMVSCSVDPNDPASTWSDPSGRQTTTLGAFGRGKINGPDATLRDFVLLAHSYDGNGSKDPKDKEKITETLDRLTFSSGDILSVTNHAKYDGDESIFSYTTDVEINPLGSGSPWFTVASFTDNGTDIIDLADILGLDLTFGDKFDTRVVTTVDYDYTGINCRDGDCGSVFVDRVTARFVPEPSSFAVLFAGLGFVGFAFRCGRKNMAAAKA